MNHFFAYIDRMRYIERWALMRNSVRENIQEHSHQVAATPDLYFISNIGPST